MPYRFYDPFRAADDRPDLRRGDRLLPWPVLGAIARADGRSWVLLDRASPPTLRRSVLGTLLAYDELRARSAYPMWLSRAGDTLHARGLRAEALDLAAERLIPPAIFRCILCHVGRLGVPDLQPLADALAVAIPLLMYRLDRAALRSVEPDQCDRHQGAASAWLHREHPEALAAIDAPARRAAASRAAAQVPAPEYGPGATRLVSPDEAALLRPGRRHLQVVGADADAARVRALDARIDAEMRQASSKLRGYLRELEAAAQGAAVAEEEPPATPGASHPLGRSVTAS